MIRSLFFHKTNGLQLFFFVVEHGVSFVVLLADNIAERSQGGFSEGESTVERSSTK